MLGGWQVDGRSKHGQRHEQPMWLGSMDTWLWVVRLFSEHRSQSMSCPPRYQFGMKKDNTMGMTTTIVTTIIITFIMSLHAKLKKKKLKTNNSNKKVWTQTLNHTLTSWGPMQARSSSHGRPVQHIPLLLSQERESLLGMFVHIAPAKHNLKI